MTAARQAIHQGFLPSQETSRAFVWKYTPVNWGRRPRHYHIEPELNLIASGHATFGIGESIVEVGQGDLLRLPPAQDHVLLAASPDLYLFAIGMDATLSSEVLRADQDQVMLPSRLRLADADFRALVNRASAIVDRGGVEQSCAELWEQAYWLTSRPHLRSATATCLHVLTRRALAAVSRDPEIGLETLAKRMQTDSSEISRYFHRDVGMTFVRFRTRFRLVRLIRLMDESDLALGEAAQKAGFGSYSQCHRIFQAELGCSPQRFFHAGLRQQMQQAYDP
jgi:AraC-like DNA-binding protein/mannose-6-phosphate isomerase-like protein (cupin superfamily)